MMEFLKAVAISLALAFLFSLEVLLPARAPIPTTASQPVGSSMSFPASGSGHGLPPDGLLAHGPRRAGGGRATLDDSALVASPLPVAVSALRSEAQRFAEQSCRLPVLWRVTGYCPCPICCGPAARGITASGRPVTACGGRIAAVPPEVPFGTVIDVPGYGLATVLDRGGAIKGRRLDLFFPTHAQARAWGVRFVELNVKPVKPVRPVS